MDFSSGGNGTHRLIKELRIPKNTLKGIAIWKIIKHFLANKKKKK
jgi:hypothetical protein